MGGGGGLKHTVGVCFLKQPILHNYGENFKLIRKKVIGFLLYHIFINKLLYFYYFIILLLSKNNSIKNNHIVLTVSIKHFY